MKYLTKEQALQKLRHYCSYQERSHYEVIQKLWELSIKKSEHDEIIELTRVHSAGAQQLAGQRSP